MLELKFKAYGATQAVEFFVSKRPVGMLREVDSAEISAAVLRRVADELEQAGTTKERPLLTELVNDIKEATRERGKLPHKVLISKDTHEALAKEAAKDGRESLHLYPASPYVFGVPVEVQDAQDNETCEELPPMLLALLLASFARKREEESGGTKAGSRG